MNGAMGQSGAQETPPGPVMKLTHIRDVIAAAEHGSLRAAARHLGIAQPSITRSIREIEQVLGAPLFERHQQGMRLTAAGKVFLRRAQAVQAELRRAAEEVGQLQGTGTGEVSIAMSAISTFALMPQAVRAFRQKYPQAILKITESFFQAVSTRILDGHLDFYVGPYGEDTRMSRFVVEHLFDNERVVIARAGHRLARARSLEDLAGAEWVKQALPDRSSDGDFERKFIELNLPRPRIVMHTTSSTATLLAVANSDLLTSVPKQMLGDPISARLFDVLPLRERLEAAPICMVRSAGLSLTPLAEYLSDMVRRAAMPWRLHRR